MIAAYPLQWPTGWPRTPTARREAARFNKGERQYSSVPGGSWTRKRDLTVTDGTERVLTGYRELSQTEIDLMNRIKAVGESVGALLADISYGNPGGGEAPEGIADARWYAIARTHLQEGFMALTRAVAKPTSF